jgi:RNA polymerase sigma factor (sigma-70 family)
LFEDDKKFVSRLLAKDAESWDHLVHRYGPFLQVVAVQVGLTDDEAKEVVQNSLASLWEDDAKVLRVYEGRASLRTYLARIIHRDCIDFLRQKNRERRKVERKKDAYLVEAQKGGSKHMDNKLDVEFLLGKLEPKWKFLAKLIYYDGLSSEEVAVIFGTKPSTVDVWHFRLREKLRKLAGASDSSSQEERGGNIGEVS